MDDTTAYNSIADTSVAAIKRPPSSVPIKATARARIAEKIRSELNIEKWPAIWQPAKSKNKPVLRVMEREMATADGNRIVSRVEIGYTQLGTLSTEEQKMLYVLIKLWEDSGKPDTQVFFSSRELARMLKKKGWGTNVIQAITKSLRKLRTIPIEWINSYHDQTKQGAVIVDRRPLTLLGDLRIVERHQDGAVNSSKGYFRFDDHILTNLQTNYTKPVCIDEFFRLRSEIAQLIYSHIDLIMFDKSKYERRSQELFDDLGLRNAEYGHMYERKRAIEKALKELQGIRLSSGVIKSAAVEKTADGKDYKVSFSKSSIIAKVELAATELLPEVKTAGVIINDYSKKDPMVEQAEQVVRHFHKIFHKATDHSPQSKETSQALALVTQHGLELALHVIDFAYDTAKDTNFSIQTFGGTLQYTSRALVDFETSKKVAQSPVIETFTRQEPRFERGEARLVSLTQEQYAVRFVRAKEELLRQTPAMGKFLKKEDSAIVDRMVRGRIVRQLETEPMDLMKSSDVPEWFKPSIQLPQNLPS